MKFGPLLEEILATPLAPNLISLGIKTLHLRLFTSDTCSLVSQLQLL